MLRNLGVRNTRKDGLNTSGRTQHFTIVLKCSQSSVTVMPFRQHSDTDGPLCFLIEQRCCSREVAHQMLTPVKGETAANETQLPRFWRSARIRCR